MKGCGQLTPPARPKITAMGIPTPIPIFAPALKPPSLLLPAAVGSVVIVGVEVTSSAGMEVVVLLVCSDVVELVVLDMGVTLEVEEVDVEASSSTLTPRVKLKY